MKKNLLSLSLLTIMPAFMSANGVDFDQIRCWSGSGDCRSALVIQFNTESDSHGYVFGYRWPSGTTVTGEQMMREICRDSRLLCMLTQFTGTYGSTLCGVGLSESQNVLNCLMFDFEEAVNDPDSMITFDYYDPSGANVDGIDMGQTGAPGDDTPELCRKAIDDAQTTHVVQHPIDASAYGYPAYDYDYWRLDETSPDYNDNDLWESGWYKGYWSYWLGSANSGKDLTYSGMGFSSRILTDGSIDAWSYTRNMDDWYSAPPGDNLIYIDASMTSIAENLNVSETTPVYYTLGGTRLDRRPTAPGIYVVIIGNKAHKITINMHSSDILSNYIR